MRHFKFIAAALALVILVACANLLERKMGKLEVGQLAPDFTTTDQNGTKFQLSQFRGKKNVVLAFYPKDMTPG